MLKTPILAIFRGITKEQVEALATCCINTNIDTLEVTMNTPNVENIIKKFIEVSEGKLTIGAGTILSLKDYQKAISAGAKFIVTPVVNLEVIKKCKNVGIPVFPGALTPTEVWQAWEAGATMVKVFPAGALGPKYLKTLHGPLDGIKLMPVGGVNTNTLQDYFYNGASAVAIGGSIFSKERLQNNQYLLIEKELKKLTSLLPLNNKFNR
jgi:2-dehydro-3-deoxyphosphogluconate aldolase/(4S)-4-hydroxy-2-oxoglutarate aldolase